MTTLEGWTLPQTPSGRTATVPPPPWHYSGDVIAVDFEDSELSLLRGLIQGFPKKLGEVHMTRPVEIGRGGSRKAPGERFAAHVSSLGRRLATVSVTIREEAAGAQPGGGGPLIHTRHWPSLENETPAIHELSLVSVRDVENGTMWRGDATLEFGTSDFEEVDLLAPRSVGSGWVYATAFSVVGGKTLPIGGDR